MVRELRVVIIGAGFAGLQVAQQLANTNFDVVLIDRKNYHTFTPLLHQVATAELEPQQVAYPIRLLLRHTKNVRFVMAEVQQIELQKQTVVTNHAWFNYDFLVVATGSTTQFRGVLGANQHSLSLKTVEDAIAIHDHILRCFELAMQPNPQWRQALLTFVIVGGGATGVELAGALAEWVRRSLIRDYSLLDCQQIRLVLLHSGSHLLNAMPSRLQAYAHQQLQRLGVEIHLNTRVAEVQPHTVHLQDGTTLEAETIVWVTGVQSTAPTNWNLPMTSRQQVRVLPTLQVVGHETVYAIGDIAALEQQKPLPMLAAIAVQQGKSVAQNLQRQARGRSLQPFHYRHFGSMAILGRHAAVVQIKRWTLTGFVAWLLWLMVHLMLLRGYRQRLLTLLNWLSSYGWSERASQVSFRSTRPKTFV